MWTILAGCFLLFLRRQRAVAVPRWVQLGWLCLVANLDAGVSIAAS
jgi:hypothetical protein